MATIKRREGKTGISYLIRVSNGYDVSGNQVVHSMTWRPEPGMKPKQIEKELQRQAVLFEEQCAGKGANGSIKFEAFARQWFQEYAEPNLRIRTVARLHQFEERTYTALGHIRLDKLTSRHIQSFINNLGEDGISTRRAGARAKGLPRDITQKELANRAGVGPSTVSSAYRGERVSLNTAEKISVALGKNMKDLFTVESVKESLSSKTIRNYHSFVSSVLGYAVRMGMIRDNPARNVILPPLEHSERVCYTLEEAQRFLDSLENAPTKYQAFFVLAIYGGFRRGELLGLEWKDIDFKDHIISIRRTSLYTKGKGVFTDTTKTARSQRTLKLPLAVFDILKKHRTAQAEERLKLGGVWHDSDRLFVNWDGQPMHPNTPYHWLRGFCKETGQRFLGVHQFRHLNATLLITSGTDARTVSAALGHSQTSTTLNIYTHTFQEAQARADEAVAVALEQSISKTG